MIDLYSIFLKKVNNRLLTVIILFFTVSCTFGQSAGKLAGRVTEAGGEGLIGANIIVIETKQGAATDPDGYYSIINMKPGVYTVRIGYIGYQSKVIEKVRISSDQTKTLNVELMPQTIQGDEVIITAKKPLVEFNQTSSVSSINKDEIKNLPLQSLNDIVNLQAGVVDGHFRGGRIGEVQYQVDGVTVNNPFNNSSSLELDRSVLEEVQVISGTFDAKYGQAMSGVVNAVLKSGSDKFEWSGELYFGDYYSTDTKRYPQNNSFNPLTIRNIQLTLSGPTGLPQTTFFVSGRHYGNDGYLFGERRFKPTDRSDFQNKVFNNTGDGKNVPMSTTFEYNGQAKVSNRSFENLEFSYQATYNWAERYYYNHGLRLNPDGASPKLTSSLTHGLTFTHTIDKDLFYRLNLRQNSFAYKDYYYESVYDPRYAEAGEFKSDANYENGAIVQGIDLGRYKQETDAYIAKFDLTWQLTRRDFVETGAEFQYSKISFGAPGFFVSTSVGGSQVLLPRENWPRIPGYQSYHPRQFAAYLQDRIELGDLVVRGGVRYELFDAKSFVPGDLQNPANTITGAPVSEAKSTSVKSAFAPRLGLSFPITASAAVYFSYGHFYQLPGLGLLYDNANYSLLDELQAGGVSYGVMGNPDLNPEKTVQYEFGIKQSFGELIGSELTFFYKDIRDLLGVEFVGTYSAAEYARFTNVDFGSVYGVTLSLSQREFSNFSSSVDYTLQFAKGNSSDPRESASRAASGKDPRPRYIPFGWDQRHTLNATLVYFVANDFSISAIFRFGSGQPYTPEIGYGFGADLETNSGTKNSYTLLDLRGEKYFDFGPVNFSVFLRAFNVLGTHFVNGFVFNNTGSPDYTLNPAIALATLGDPSRFYAPRRIELGISFRSL
ncbi:MAG: TonB-dependent receptor [Ignavibacteriaceae bacterium]|nr:TonB-dependent receptor [Ignavibacteriaceae bacterium]